MPEIINKVTLGITSGAAREFAIKGDLVEAPISDFAAQIRVGEASYDTRQGAGYVVLETLHGGGGLLEGKSRSDIGRWAWNTGCYTGINGQLLRPLNTVTGSGVNSSGGYATDIRARSGWSGNDPLAGAVNALPLMPVGKVLYQLDTAVEDTSWTGVVTGTNGIGAPTVFFPQTGADKGNTIWAVHTYGSVYTRKTGTTWTEQASLPTSVTSIIGFGDFLLMNDLGNIKYSADGINPVLDTGGVDPDIIAYTDPFASFLGIWRSPWGDAAPYLLIAGRVYVLHFTARKLFEVPLPISGIQTVTGFEEGMVLSNGRETYFVSLGDSMVMRQANIFPDQGAPSGEDWYVHALCTSPAGVVYAQLFSPAASKSWVFEWNGLGWNPWGRPQTCTAPQGILALDLSQKLAIGGLATPQPIVWHFGTTQAYQVKGASKVRSPYSDSSFTYDSTAAYVETEWMDMGFNELRGAMFEIWYGNNMPSGGTLAVSYALDGSTSFTNLGTITDATDPPRLRFSTPDASGAIPGTEFRRIKFRFTPAGANVNALPLTIVYRKKPLLRWGFSFTIDVSHMRGHPSEYSGWGASITWDNVADFIKTLWNSKTQLYFSVADRETTRVNISNLSYHEQEIRSTIRRGHILVQLEEAVDGG